MKFQSLSSLILIFLNIQCHHIDGRKGGIFSSLDSKPRTAFTKKVDSLSKLKSPADDVRGGSMSLVNELEQNSDIEKDSHGSLEKTDEQVGKDDEIFVTKRDGSREKLDRKKVRLHLSKVENYFHQSNLFHA